MTYLVFWIGDRHIGSVENTPENQSEMRELMSVRLIQRDTTGTEHYDVRPKRNSR